MDNFLKLKNKRGKKLSFKGKGGKLSFKSFVKNIGKSLKPEPEKPKIRKDPPKIIAK